MVPIRAFLSTIALFGIATSISAIANPSSLPVQDYEPMNYEGGKIEGGKIEGHRLKRRDGVYAPICDTEDPELKKKHCVIVVEGPDYDKHRDLLETLKARTNNVCSYFSGLDKEDRWCIFHSTGQRDELYSALNAAGVQYAAGGGVNRITKGGG